MLQSAVAPVSTLPFIQRLQAPAKTERAPLHLRCYGAHTPGRRAVEAYIAGAFRQQYDAHIDHFLPVLLTLEASGTIDAALGIRCAERGELFVEHYLDQPIDAELQQRGIAHRAVVEIGNLVSTRAGSSQLLFILLTELLQTLGRDTGVFTATAHVAQLLGKLGCGLTTLCAADGTRLGAQLAQWGSYYDTEPHVIAADVAATSAQLRARPVLQRTFEHYAPEIARIAAQLRFDDSTPLAASA